MNKKPCTRCTITNDCVVHVPRLSKDFHKEQILDLLSSAKIVSSETIAKTFNIRQRQVTYAIRMLKKRGHRIRTIRDIQDMRRVQYVLE